MKFKLDENLGHRWLPLFEQAGHEADSVLQEKLSGAPDRAIYEVCSREQRTLVTLDLDFADVVRFPPSSLEGIAILRPPRGNSPAILELLIRNLLAMESESIRGGVWIIEPTRIRIHTPADL